MIRSEGGALINGICAFVRDPRVLPAPFTMGEHSQNTAVYTGNRPLPDTVSAGALTRTF